MTVPLIIAEIGSNWRGEQALLLECVDAAADAGADVVKFQIGLDRLFARKRAPKHWAATQAYEFPLAMLPALYERARLRGLQTCASILAVSLVEDPQVYPYIDIFKVASGDMVEDSMVIACTNAALKKGTVDIHLVVSTGAATRKEIYEAASTVRQLTRDIHGFKYALMRCTSEYPTTPSTARLQAFGLNHNYHLDGMVKGYSDHTLSNISAVTAVGAGYKVFEHHFDPWKDIDEPSPDTVVSFSRTKFASYTSDIEAAFRALGKAIEPEFIEAERAERLWARRGLDGLRPTSEAGE